MRQYLDLVDGVLSDGTFKSNRTGVHGISSFGQQYRVDLADGFPLLTTKEMTGFRWESLIHEFLWYLSGAEHIRALSEETAIWDAWADEEGRLDTAYGRFWRRYPVPESNARLAGESWPEDGHRWTTEEDGRVTFDQIQYAIDRLNESPHSRRIVINAWHPANAAVSTLPPCHYTFVFSVQADRLNVQLTQRSGDVALGIPFNIAAYSLLCHAIAARTGFAVGEFVHSVVDAHVYCGQAARGEWYRENLPRLQARLGAVERPADYLEVREWLLDQAPPEESADGGLDHVPGLLEQCARTPRPRPRIEIADKPLDSLVYDDIALHDYESESGLSFAVAE